MFDKIFSHPKRDIAQKAVDKHHLGYDKEKDKTINAEKELSDSNKYAIDCMFDALNNTNKYLSQLFEKNKELNEKLESYTTLKAQVSNLLPYIDTGTFMEFCETDDYGCIINDIISKLDKMEDDKNENN